MFLFLKINNTQKQEYKRTNLRHGFFKLTENSLAMEILKYEKKSGTID